MTHEYERLIITGLGTPCTQYEDNRMDQQHLPEKKDIPHAWQCHSGDRCTTISAPTTLQQIQWAGGEFVQIRPLVCRVNVPGTLTCTTLCFEQFRNPPSSHTGWLHPALPNDNNGGVLAIAIAYDLCAGNDSSIVVHTPAPINKPCSMDRFPVRRPVRRAHRSSEDTKKVRFCRVPYEDNPAPPAGSLFHIVPGNAILVLNFCVYVQAISFYTLYIFTLSI